MRPRLRIKLLLPLLCLAPALLLASVPAWAQFSAVRVTDQLTRPVLATAPAGDPRIFVVEQGGRIRIWDGVGLSTFLDLSLLVSGGNEQGLLGLAFAPDYASSGLFYVHYTDLAGDSVISRFEVSGGDPDLADPLSEEMLLVVPQPFANHNAGHLAFSPLDGFLYIAMGDGGLGGDPGENGQDPSTLLGSMLRIDVSSAPGFTIPASNPFVGGGGDPLVWSYGFRNPYRFSFDRSTGDLWIGDVGQGTIEEIDFQPASSTGGENYGWDCWEGSVLFEPAGCPPTGFVFPVMEYAHTLGLPFYAVIGGYRYRGPEPGLDGIYFFGDNGGALFTGVEVAPGVFTQQTVSVSADVGSIDNVGGFGEDSAGNLYFLDLFDGEMFRLVAGASGAGCPAVEDSMCREDALSIAVLKDREAPTDPMTTGPKARLTFRWVRGGTQGTPVSQSDFGNPVLADDIDLCFYRDSLLDFSLRAPGGSAAWKELGTKGYRYSDPSTSSDGIRMVVLSGGAAGRARVVVSAKGSAIPLPAFPVAGTSWSFQVRSSGSSQCWAGSFTAPDLKANDAKGIFRAKRQGP